MGNRFKGVSTASGDVIIGDLMKSGDIVYLVDKAGDLNPVDKASMKPSLLFNDRHGVEVFAGDILANSRDEYFFMKNSDDLTYAKRYKRSLEIIKNPVI